MTTNLHVPVHRRTATRLRSTLPRPARRALTGSYWAFQRATSAGRLLPDFAIIGGQRCGSTALFRYLLHHPAVSGYFRKEARYFDRNYQRGPAWYRAHFPLAGFATYVRRRYGCEPAIGEATPNYLFHPHAARRMHEFNPDMRLVALLRDPVDRAISNYHLERALGNETLSLRDALQAEPGRVDAELERAEADETYWGFDCQHFSYVARGRYAEQLERWLEQFRLGEQLLVLRSEDLFAAPLEVTNRVLDFLGLTPLAHVRLRPENARAYPDVDAESRRHLLDRFDQPNGRLEALLGTELRWQRSEGVAREATAS
jgi:hypothetical protein